MPKNLLALLILILALSFLTPPSAPAALTRSRSQQPPIGEGWTLTPGVAAYFFSGEEDLEDTPLYGLKFGYEKIGKSIPDSLGIEGTLNYFQTRSTRAEGTVKGYLIRVDALYPIILKGKSLTSLIVGGGEIITNGANSNDSRALFNYGVGIKYFLEDYLALRSDARQLFIYDNIDTRHNFELSIGLSYYFGKERKRSAQARGDSDRDGVADHLDKCPETPKDVKVGADGCP